LDQDSPEAKEVLGAIISDYWLRLLIRFITSVDQRRESRLWRSLHVAFRTFVGI
jgi:hypothetical protein